MALKQENRMLRVNTPMGEDVVVATGFRGHEEISRPFHFDLDLISDDNAISASQIVGKNVTVSIELVDGSMRHFNAFVSRFFAGDEDWEGRRNYRVELVPWLWFLTRTTDCRIFQEKTAVQIIEQIFQDLGFSDFETSQIKGEHPEQEYCAQYRESDFDFVSRLMEQEGILYFFRHEDGKHTLVLADQKGVHQDCGESQVDFPRDAGTRAVDDHIKSWEHRYEYRSGKWAQTDYNFKDHPARNEPTPGNLLMTNENSMVQLDNVEKYELYDYPGLYTNTGDGGAYTKTRMEEEEVPHDVVDGSSNCKTFAAGYKFKIKSHKSGSEEGKSFLFTAIDHQAEEPWAYETGTPVGGDYRNTFTCIPDSVTFRPERLTPKPVVQGMQTAVVTGPRGEEIWPDKYGRVKVQFFWDREGQRDENSSCWVRVSQPYSGKNWGWMCIPRIGQEVVVCFLEGDPDRPLITGVVYNEEQMPAYTLPDEKTKSYMKTNSSPGGDGYNEIRFEDKADQEQIFVHAQRNMDLRVAAEYKEFVGGQRNLIVGTQQAPHDHHEYVWGSRTISTDTVMGLFTREDLMISVGPDGDYLTTVEKNKRECIKVNSELHVGGDRMDRVVGSQSLIIEMGDKHEKVEMGHYALEAFQNIHLKSGFKAVIEAELELTLKAAGGFIKIDPMGITIQGNLVNINSGGSPGSGRGASPDRAKEFSLRPPPMPNMADDSTSGQKSTPF